MGEDLSDASGPGQALGVLDVHGRQPHPRRDDGGFGGDEAGRHRRRHHPGGQHRHSARDRPVHERTLASVAEARHPRSRSPRAGNRPGRRAGVVRHRRAVGQTRAINAASRRQRDEGDGADALRSPVAATQTTHPLLWRNHVDPSTAQGVGRILPGRGGAGVPHAHRHLPDPGRK